MTVVKIKRAAPPPEEEAVVEVDYAGAQDGEWKAERLYSRGQDGRRVLFLEFDGVGD